MINVFGREMCNLLIILAIFDSSFVLRYAVNLSVYEAKIFDISDANICLDSEGNKHVCEPYRIVLYDEISQYFWDYIPIMAILLFHKSNFKIKDTVLLEGDNT